MRRRARTSICRAARRCRSGHRLRNPELAAVLRRVADEGPDAFYRGDIARDIAAAVAAQPSAGDLTEADLAGYRAIERAPVCGRYRMHRICGMPPPSSGGIGVLAILGMLERFPLSRVRGGSGEAIHLFAEAGRLAYADRDHYVGDPAFVRVPIEGLIDPAYLRERSSLIRPQRSMGRAGPGSPRARRRRWEPTRQWKLQVRATSPWSMRKETRWR